MKKQNTFDPIDLDINPKLFHRWEEKGYLDNIEEKTNNMEQSPKPSQPLIDFSICLGKMCGVDITEEEFLKDLTTKNNMQETEHLTITGAFAGNLYHRISRLA